MQRPEDNMAAIRKTNQRGGRCLSITDLIDANTISAEAAGFCWTAIHAGSSFITGAVPGGAGKTTLMAALLAFLPPAEKIITVQDHEVLQNIENAPQGARTCLLAHEIGQGPWFAYIWGETAARFFRLKEAGHRPVTCLHADAPEQTESILSSCGVSEKDIQSIDLHLYIRNIGTSRRKHRVTRIDYRGNGSMTPVYRYDEQSDALVRDQKPNTLADLIGKRCAGETEQVQESWDTCTHQLHQLQQNGITRFESVRDRILEVYGET